MAPPVAGLGRLRQLDGGALIGERQLPKPQFAVQLRTGFPSRAQLRPLANRLVQTMRGVVGALPFAKSPSPLDQFERILQARDAGETSEFEVEHPRLTGILNDIMVALSNLGI